MAFSLVQSIASGSFDAVDSGTQAFGSNVGSGSLLIVAGAAWGSSAAPTSITVTDDRSTSYTVVLGAIPSGLTWRTFIAYGVAPSGGACTVTVNPNGASHSFSWSQGEFTGQHASPASVNGGDTTGAAVHNTAFTLSDTIVTATANELVVAVCSHDVGTRTLTAGAGWTTLGENESNANNQSHHAIYQIVTTATTYTPTVEAAGDGTGDASPGWSMQSHSFKESTGGGAAPFVGSIGAYVM